MKRNVQKEGDNNYVYGVIFVVFAIIFEVANFLRMKLGFLPTHFGLEFSIILLLAGLVFMIPGKWAKIVLSSVFLAFQLGLNIANESMFKVLYDFITMDMIFNLSGEAGAFWDFSFVDWIGVVINVGIALLYILTLVLACKFMPRVKFKKFSSVLVMLMISIVIESGGLVGFTVCDNIYSSSNSSEYVFENTSNLYGSTALKFANMKNFGFYGFYLKNVELFFGYDKTASKKEMQNLEKFVAEGENFVQTGSTFGDKQVSGLLSGDNLVLILLESFEWFAIDPINTPNLYSFVNEQALSLTNFYGRNKTNVSEQISILGSVPNDYSFQKIYGEVGIDTPNSLPNLFSQEGYESIKFFHDHRGETYQRHKINSAFGFDEVLTIEQSTFENKKPSLQEMADDGEYLETCIDEFMPADKSFFTYFTTMSTHGPYNISGVNFKEYYQKFDENYEQFCEYVRSNNLNYLTPKVGSKNYKLLKEFKSKAMAMDRAIKVMMDYLSSTNGKDGKPLSDSTTIMMFADHNAYYSDLSYIVKNVGKYDMSSEAYNIPCVIYSSKLGSGKIDTFCNTYDIHPTICDLFGLSYNKNLTQGYSVFSKDIENSVFLSSMCGVWDANCYSLNMDKYHLKDATNKQEKILLFKDKVNNFLKKQQQLETYYRVNFAKLQ